VLPAAAAEKAALAVVPLLTLLVAMVLVRQLMREVEASNQTIFVAVALIPLFPMLAYNFAPMRIDHHAWQAVAALAATWLMVRGGWREAFFAGLIASVWLNISLEGLPLAAILGGLFAVRYWLQRRCDHEGFLLGLALGGPALFLVTRPAETLAVAYCDVPSWPHFLAFAAAAGVAAGARLMPGQDRALGRLAALAPVGIAAAALMIAPLGACALFPMASLDPFLQQRWFANLAESAPLTSQTPSVAVSLLWTIALIAGGAWLAYRRAQTPVLRERWLLLAAMALGAGALSLWVMRVGIIAQLLALPFAAVLLLNFLPRARAVAKTLPRVTATVACFGLATPAFAAIPMRPFDREDPLILAQPVRGKSWKPCNFDRLKALPAATLYAPLDLGPEILARTPHRVIMGGYHRNQALMLSVFGSFAGPLDQARRTILASDAEYVVVCTGTCDITVYSQLGTGSLADRLLAKRPPGWLEPVRGFERGSLLVWRIRR